MTKRTEPPQRVPQTWIDRARAIVAAASADLPAPYTLELHVRDVFGPAGPQPQYLAVELAYNEGGETTLFTPTVAWAPLERALGQACREYAGKAATYASFRAKHAL